MALVVADRVQETTSTTSTSDYVLLGAAAGYQSFGAVLANGDTTYYAITNDTDWEVGLGTYSTTGPTLARTTILASSNGGSAVSWGVGVKNIFISYAASKSVYLDASGNLSVADKIIHTGDTNTAIRFPAADTVSIETGGTERFKVENAAITTTVPVVLPADPTTSLQAATKSYVDTIASASIHYHAPVRVESPTALTVTYNNGTSGVGATLTNAGAQAALVLDGVTLSVNDRVLIYTQADQTQNGVYTVTSVGSVSTNWVLTRSDDTDSYGASSPTALGAGDAFFVSQGATGAGELYVCNTTGTITFGTTNITFVQVAATAVYTAGTGISVTNNIITNTAPDQTVALTQGGATTITGTYPNFTISSTDTTYTAGDGIGLTGTTFSVAAGTGLTQDADGLSHADTSSQASVDNTGATFVQDINLDGFGHVTGAASVTVTPSLIGAPQNDGTGATGTWGISISGNANNVSGTVSVSNGGTGATTAPQALTNLAAAPLASPAFTGQASFADGSAAAPSIAHTGDLNAGLFFPAADTVAVSTGGTERMRINSSGNVGIGTSSPTEKLDIVGAIKTTSTAYIGSRAVVTGNLEVNTNVFYVNASTGDVGVGTNSPNFKFDVVGTANATTLSIGGTAITATATELNYTDGVTSAIQTQLDAKAPAGSPTFTGQVSIPDGTAAAPALTHTGDTDTGVYFPAANQVGIATSGVRRAIVNDSSLIAYGTSIQLEGNANPFFSMTGPTYGRVLMSMLSGVDGKVDFTAYTAAFADGSFTFNGNVGIGTGSPSGKVSAERASTSAGWAYHFKATGVANDSGFYMTASNNTEMVLRDGSGNLSLIANSGNNLALSTAGTERMRIDASGNVGIGTNSPTAKLDVNGTTNLGGSTTVPAGVTTTADNDGTFSSGTYTPTPVGGNMKTITNSGAFTFAAPSAAGDYTLVVLVMNSATAGAVTLSGFNRTVGDAFTTTNGSEFLVNITKINGYTLANVVAMQ